VSVQSLVGLSLIAVLGASSAAFAQPQTPAPAAAAVQPAPVGLALAVFPSKTGKVLTVSSPAFADGADIPFENTMYRGNVFPGLAWSKGPYGTRSYVVIMQDADAHYRGGPLLHWSMINIPLKPTKLDAGLKTPPQGASFGPNVRGLAQAYMGPHTPPGPKHHYHFAVLALDEFYPPGPCSYDQLAAAIEGHVLASGEVVGLGQADPNAPPPPPKPPAPPAAPAVAPPAPH
jgi:para-nitrobenzyl esterase